MKSIYSYWGRIEHGFARNVDWTVHAMDDCSVTLKLEPSEYTKAMWDQEFEVLFTTTLTAESLDTSMTVTNKGGNSFDFQAALHSYFDLSDISQASVSGSIKGTKFLNKLLDPPAMQEETRDEIVIAEEYDRVYMGVVSRALTSSFLLPFLYSSTFEMISHFALVSCFSPQPFPYFRTTAP